MAAAISAVCGASADFTVTEAFGPALPEVELPDAKLPSVSDAAGAAVDADELAIPLLAPLLVLGLALASLWVV
ncbi:hypothetical protein [Azohydromonas australica]|uniref:hypothetical protein n=1 Tax=Azohydromonas australica TaxID=364039 RepID=UPI00048E1866|nr:hypothetical protein [Azohydromonas australica]